MHAHTWCEIHKNILQRRQQKTLVLKVGLRKNLIGAASLALAMFYDFSEALPMFSGSQKAATILPFHSCFFILNVAAEDCFGSEQTAMPVK